LRKAALLLFLVVVLCPVALLAQYPEPWRSQPYPRDNFFELTPVIGYRWGGTIHDYQTDLFRTDADVQSSANYGGIFAIPVTHSGMKVELMIDHQSSRFQNGNGLFEPSTDLGDVDVTYYHAGLLVPFLETRELVPFAQFSAGLANIDPKIHNATSEDAFSMGFGLGMKVPVNRHLAVRVEGRGYFTFLSDHNHNNHCDHNCYDYYYSGDTFYQGSINLGLAFRF
jgi:outer membrane protein with beta-barrel domain